MQSAFSREGKAGVVRKRILISYARFATNPSPASIRRIAALMRPRTRIVPPVNISVVKMVDAAAQDMGNVPILWHNPNITARARRVKPSHPQA